METEFLKKVYAFSKILMLDLNHRYFLAKEVVHVMIEKRLLATNVIHPVFTSAN